MKSLMTCVAAVAWVALVIWEMDSPHPWLPKRCLGRGERHEVGLRYCTWCKDIAPFRGTASREEYRSFVLLG